MTVVVQDVEPADVLVALCGETRLTPAEHTAMMSCLAVSEDIWMGTIDDRITFAWGLIPPTLLSDVAYLWLYAPIEIPEEFKFTFIRQSQIEMEKMLSKYMSIIGHVKIDNYSAIRWLNWLGAEFGRIEGDLRTFSINNARYEDCKHG